MKSENPLHGRSECTSRRNSRETLFQENRKIKVLKLMPCALYNTQYFKLINLETSLPPSLSHTQTHTHTYKYTCALSLNLPKMAEQPSGKGIQSTLLFPPWVALSSLDPLLQSFIHPREGAVQGRRWDPVSQASSDGTLTGQLRHWQSLQFSRFFRAPAPTPRPGTGAF